MVTIEDNRKIERTISDLSIGEYFIYDGDLYVVIINVLETADACDNYYESNVMNALDLKSGVLYRINEETVVTPVDVKIIIS